ncbi:MAG: hypothetical protein JWO32_1990 [Bacteroidetes bacterium]|nr:hypothetical protein [Bacteroidota bacterium]
MIFKNRLLKPLLLTLLVAGMFSCSNEEEIKIPENILSKEQYTRVLTDLALAESAANLNIKNVRIEKTDSTYAFDPLKENNISKARYDSSALYYAEHPELYKEVYDEVLKRLSEMQSKRKGVLTDSLKK